MDDLTYAMNVKSDLCWMFRLTNSWWCLEPYSLFIGWIFPFGFNVLTTPNKSCAWLSQVTWLFGMWRRWGSCPKANNSNVFKGVVTGSHKTNPCSSDLFRVEDLAYCCALTVSSSPPSLQVTWLVPLLGNTWRIGRGSFNKTPVIGQLTWTTHGHGSGPIRTITPSH